MTDDREKIIKFIKKYEHLYPGYESERIQNKIKYGYTCDVNQIYYHLNLIDVRNTDYFEFFNIIKGVFDLNGKNILEIASGYIPVLSDIISKQTNSKIKAVNKKILFENYNNIITEEADLKKYYDVKDYDLIIGFRPCDVTENMLKLAIKNKKNFCFYMCPCSLKPTENHFKGRWSKNRWYEYLKNLIQNEHNYELKVITSKNLLDDCPIFIGKYKKL